MSSRIKIVTPFDGLSKKERERMVELLQLDAWNLGSCGAATSRPYVVVSRLTRSFSDRLMAEAAEAMERIKAKTKGWSAKQLKQSGLLIINRDLDAARTLPTRLLGYDLKIEPFESVKFGNGHMGAKYRDIGKVLPEAGFRDGVGIDVGRDADGRLMVAAYHIAVTEPVEESRMRRKNWPRAEKRREFLKKCRNLENQLVAVSGGRVVGIGAPAWLSYPCSRNKFVVVEGREIDG